MESQKRVLRRDLDAEKKGLQKEKKGACILCCYPFEYPSSSKGYRERAFLSAKGYFGISSLSLAARGIQAIFTAKGLLSSLKR